MRDVEVVELPVTGVCPKCGADYGPAAIAPEASKRMAEHIVSVAKVELRPVGWAKGDMEGRLKADYKFVNGVPGWVVTDLNTGDQWAVETGVTASDSGFRFTRRKV